MLSPKERARIIDIRGTLGLKKAHTKMAGIIKFDQGSWHVANLCFIGMVDGVLPFLSTDDSGKQLKQLLEEQAEAGFYYFEIDELSESMIAEFKKALDAYLVESEAQLQSVAMPGQYQGYIDRLRELQNLLETQLTSKGLQ